MQEEKVHVRLLIVAGVALLWMTAVFGRLGYLQLVQHSEYFARAHRQQQRTIEITPKRGAIYDRNMHPLAMSVPVESAFAVPTELGDNKSMAAHLLSGMVQQLLAAGRAAGVMCFRLQTRRPIQLAQRVSLPVKR